MKITSTAQGLLTLADWLYAYAVTQVAMAIGRSTMMRACLRGVVSVL